MASAQAAGGSSRAAEGPPFDGTRLLAVPASAENAALVQACLESASDYFIRAEGRPPRPDAAKELLADAEADPGRRVYALMPHRGGPAVGVLDLHLDYPEPGTAQIGLLVLGEAWRGLGYGREASAALEAGLRRMGYRALRLSVADENLEAKLFWQRLGFAEVGRLDRGITLYEKTLPP